MAVKVAVIGAGPLGLVAMKTFLEDGFDVTGFETRSYVGGLWKHSTDSTTSAHLTTSFNSSKYRSAFTDYPFPEDADGYPTAPQVHAYLTSYAEHFKLTPRIQLSTKVLDLERAGNKWAVKVQSGDGPVQTQYFDKVAISTGSYSTPKMVKLENEKAFAGSVIHSNAYHKPEPYAGKNVLMLGIHATAQDIAVSLSETANKVYMSHRNGLLLLPAYSKDGKTIDQTGPIRFVLIMAFMSSWFPRLWNWLLDKVLGAMSRKAFDVKPEWNLSPAPSIAVATPLIADKAYGLFNSGFARPIGEVKRVTGPRSVELADGTELRDIDAVIQCVGFEWSVPALPASSPYQPYTTPGAPPYLYRNVFPLHPDPVVRNSLAFFGQAGVPLPGFVQFELLAQSISQVWQGRSPLPSFSAMKDWHAANARWRSDLTRVHGSSSTFYPGLVAMDDHLRWLDRTAGAGIFDTFDWALFNSRAWRLWWSDRPLYNLCMDGLLTPSIFRLFDRGRRKVWAGAREQVFRDNEVAEREAKRRLEGWNARKEKGVNGHVNGHVNGKKCV